MTPRRRQTAQEIASLRAVRRARYAAPGAGLGRIARVLLPVLWLLGGNLNAVIGASATPPELRAQVALVEKGAPKAGPDSSNVVVWLVPLDRSPGGSPAPQAGRFRMLQKHKRFDPHLLVVSVGSVVDFPNLDPWFHNVFSLFEGKRFDLGLYESGSTHSVMFDRAGICYIFCNIHPQMSAVVVVLGTPYYAVSDTAGNLAIPSPPPGRYRLNFWCERCSPEDLSRAVRGLTVVRGQTSLGSFRLTASGNPAPAHKNKYGRDYPAPAPPNPLYDQH